MCKHISVLFVCLFFSFVNYAQPEKTALELYNEGLKLKDDGKCEEAIAKYKMAIAKKPDYADAFYEAGWCSNEIREYANAINFLNKAKQFSPESTKIYFELGYANDNNDNKDEAITDYKKVLQLDPGYKNAARNLGNIFYTENEYETAIDYYKDYINDNDNIDNFYYYRIGWCLNDIGKYDEAIGYIEKYDPTENDDLANKWAELGYANYKNSDYNAAIENYTKALDAKPDYGTAIRGIADCYYDQEDYENALPYYLQAIDKDEEHSKSCYYRIGWIYNDKENYDEAINALLKAIDYDDKDAGNFEEIGYAYYMTDKYDDAITQLDKAIALDENSKLGYYYKGLCYVALNQKDKAKEVYEKLKTVNEEQAGKLLKKINGE